MNTNKYLRSRRDKHNIKVLQSSKTVYAIRWADNLICDFLGHIQYDENRTNKELIIFIREKYGRRLKVIQADSSWTWYGDNIDMLHIERLWNTYFTKPDTNDRWEAI